MWTTTIEWSVAALVALVSGLAVFALRPPKRRGQTLIADVANKRPKLKLHPEVTMSLWAAAAGVAIVIGLLYAAFDKDFLEQVPTAKFLAPAVAIVGLFFIYRFLGAAGKYFGAIIIGVLALFFVTIGVKSMQKAALVRNDPIAAAQTRQQIQDSIRQHETPAVVIAPVAAQPVAGDGMGIADYARRISDESERLKKEETALEEAKLEMTNRAATASLNGWQASADLRKDTLDQRVTVVCTRNGIELAAQLGKRLEALGAIVTYEVREKLNYPTGGQLRYSSVNYRASTAIQAALVDLIRLDLLSQAGMVQIELILNVE